MIKYSILSSEIENKSYRILAAVALISIIPACGFASLPADAAAVDIAGTPEHTCHATMGLLRSTVEYDDCVGSLRQTVAAVQQDQSVVQDRASCAQQGLVVGTPAFAGCVVDKQDARVSMAQGR